MRALHLLIAVSVAVTLTICKPASAADEAMENTDGFRLGGYANAGINIHPGGRAEAALDEVSLILSWEGNSRFRFFSELEIDRPVSWQEGDGFSEEDFQLDVERLYADYNLSEKLNLRAGRFLTPAGRWNLIHAAPLVWTSLRPLATSRLFPTSINGAMFYGAAPLGNAAFEYTFFIEALQDQPEHSHEIQFKDTRGARFALSGKMNWGLSVLDFSEDIPGNPRFRMFGLDFMAQHKGWEASGDVFQRYYTNGSEGGSGGYLQGVAPLGNQWFAVARLETFQRPTDGSNERWVLGTAWRITPSRVLKMEYAGGDAERPDSPKGFVASFAILF